MSHDTDFVLSDLRERFEEILTMLEGISGWKATRVVRPVMGVGNFEGIETGIRQFRRTALLATTVVEYRGLRLRVPTEAEIPRI